MKVYKYKGYNVDGKKISGNILAINYYLAHQALLNDGIVSVDLYKAPYVINIYYLLKPYLLQYIKVNQDEIIRFCHEISVLLKAGMPVRSACLQMSRSVNVKALKLVLQIIVARIDAGYSLSQAFTGFPKIFPPLFVSFLKQAELAERTANIFLQLSKTLEVRSKLKRELFMAIVPFFSSLFMLVVAGYILSQIVMPELLRIYNEKDRVPPIFTVWLNNFFIYIENTFLENLFYSIITLTVARQIVCMQERWRFYWDKFMLQLPVYRRVRVILVKIDFARAVGLSLCNGFPIQNVLALATDVISDRFYKNKVTLATDSILSGMDFLAAIKKTEIFTYAEIEMLSVGEQSETLEQAFKNIVLFNSNDLRYRIKVLKEGISITMLLITTVVVCFYIVGFYLGYLYLSF